MPFRARLCASWQAGKLGRMEDRVAASGCLGAAVPMLLKWEQNVCVPTMQEVKKSREKWY